MNANGQEEKVAQIQDFRCKGEIGRCVDSIEPHERTGTGIEYIHISTYLLMTAQPGLGKLIF